MKDLTSGIKAFVLILGFFLLIPQRGNAIPAYARRYRLRCFACHVIPPVLNKEGYMFKRLGYHLPPALLKGQASPRLTELIKQEPAWSLTTNAAFAVADFDFAAQRNKQQGSTPSSTSSFQVANWTAYMSGWVPDTTFYYYTQVNLINGGNTNPSVSNGYAGYVGGSAQSSWFIQGGQMRVMGANGTMAANTESFLPNAPLMWEYADPDNFTLDQHMVGIRAGYTYALPKYKQIFGASLSVSNGDHADGSTIQGPAAKNSKDIYADVDWWFAQESGVTFLSYYGKKNQLQNSGAPNQFNFYPVIRRNGVFANYRTFQNRLNLMGGFMDDHDGYELNQTGPTNDFISKDYYGELDYFIVRGTAAIVRYDRLNQRIKGGIGGVSQEQPSFGLERTLTPSGNIIGRVSYSNLHGRDPIQGIGSSSRTAMADVQFFF